MTFTFYFEPHFGFILGENNNKGMQLLEQCRHGGELHWCGMGDSSFMFACMGKWEGDFEQKNVKSI